MRENKKFVLIRSEQSIIAVPHLIQILNKLIGRFEFNFAI